RPPRRGPRPTGGPKELPCPLNSADTTSPRQFASALMSGSLASVGPDGEPISLRSVPELPNFTSGPFAFSWPRMNRYGAVASGLPAGTMTSEGGGAFSVPRLSCQPSGTRLAGAAWGVLAAWTRGISFGGVPRVWGWRPV